MKNKLLNSVLVFIKSNWLLLLIVVCFICMIVSIEKCSSKSKTLHDLDTVKKYEDTSYKSEIKKWKDAYEQEHTRAVNLSVGEIAMQFAMDSVARLLKIKSKQIVSISKISSVLDLHANNIKVVPLIIKIPCISDSISVVKKTDFNWKDQWMNVTGTIGEDSNSINVSGNDTLVKVDYFDRKHWYSSKEWYSDFMNTNPHINVAGYKGLRMAKGNKNWSLGVGGYMGYQMGNFNFAKPQIFIGVGIQKTIFSF